VRRRAETHDERAEIRRDLTVDALPRPDPLAIPEELMVEKGPSQPVEDDDSPALKHQLDGRGR
jgi:hypothetical protein